jgi:hypothetical protein
LVEVQVAAGVVQDITRTRSLAVRAPLQVAAVAAVAESRQAVRVPAVLAVLVRAAPPGLSHGDRSSAMNLKRWALIDEQSNIVTNVVDWDGLLETWRPPAGIVPVEVPADSWYGVGDLYSPTTGEFTRPD